MGGVDRLDENIAKVRVAIRMTKWWWPMFSWLLNVSVNNAWQTYRMLARSQQFESLDLLGFTRRIDLTYVNRYSSFKDSKPVGGIQMRVISETRYDGLHHYVASTEKQIRCALCHKKSKKTMHEMWCWSSRGLLFRISHKVAVIDCCLIFHVCYLLFFW